MAGRRAFTVVNLTLFGRSEFESVKLLRFFLLAVA
jgi:hypothetical protein